MSQHSEYEKLALQRLGESIQQGKWSNDGMVQLIELIGEYLNPLSIQEYADNYKISYQAAIKISK